MATVDKRFVAACKRGDVEGVTALLTLDGTRRVNVHYKDEKAFRLACFHGHDEVAALLLNLEGDRRIDVHVMDDYAFQLACKNGHVKVVTLLLTLDGERRIDVHFGNELAFHRACMSGRVDMATLLLGLEGDRRIDVHADEEDTFRGVCYNGQDKVVALLLSLEGDRRIDVHAFNDIAFAWACVHGHVKVVALLLGLEDDRAIPTSAFTEPLRNVSQTPWNTIDLLEAALFKRCKMEARMEARLPLLRACWAASQGPKQRAVTAVTNASEFMAVTTALECMRALQEAGVLRNPCWAELRGAAPRRHADREGDDGNTEAAKASEFMRALLFDDPQRRMSWFGGRPDCPYSSASVNTGSVLRFLGE